MKQYNADFSPESIYYTLWYMPNINRFVYDTGEIAHNLSDKFPVWQLEQWKKTEDYMVLRDRNGDICEFFYPDGEFEMQMFIDEWKEAMARDDWSVCQNDSLDKEISMEGAYL